MADKKEKIKYITGKPATPTLEIYKQEDGKFTINYATSDPLNIRGASKNSDLDKEVQRLFGYESWEEYKKANLSDLTRKREPAGEDGKLKGPTVFPFHVAYAYEEFVANFDPNEYEVVGIPIGSGTPLKLNEALDYPKALDLFGKLEPDKEEDKERSEEEALAAATAQDREARPQTDYGDTYDNTANVSQIKAIIQQRKNFFGDSDGESSLSKMGVLKIAMYNPAEILSNAQDVIGRIEKNYNIKEIVATKFRGIFPVRHPGGGYWVKDLEPSSLRNMVNENPYTTQTAEDALVVDTTNLIKDTPMLKENVIRALERAALKEFGVEAANRVARMNAREAELYLRGLRSASSKQAAKGASIKGADEAGIKMAGQATQREAPAIVDMYGRTIPIRRRAPAATEKVSGYDLALTADDVATAARERAKQAASRAAETGAEPAARTGAERVSSKAAGGGAEASAGAGGAKVAGAEAEGALSLTKSIDDLEPLLASGLKGSEQELRATLKEAFEDLFKAAVEAGIARGGPWSWVGRLVKGMAKGVFLVGIPTALAVFLYVRPDLREIIMSAIQSGDWNRVLEFFTEDMPAAMGEFTPEESENFFKRLKEQESALGAGAGRLNVGQLKKIGLRYHILPKNWQNNEWLSQSEKILSERIGANTNFKLDIAKKIEKKIGDATSSIAAGASQAFGNTFEKEEKVLTGANVLVFGHSQAGGRMFGRILSAGIKKGDSQVTKKVHAGKSDRGLAKLIEDVPRKSYTHAYLFLGGNTGASGNNYESDKASIINHTINVLGVPKENILVVLPPVNKADPETYDLEDAKKQIGKFTGWKKIKGKVARTASKTSSGAVEETQQEYNARAKKKLARIKRNAKYSAARGEDINLRGRQYFESLDIRVMPPIVGTKKENFLDGYHINGASELASDTSDFMVSSFASAEEVKEFSVEDKTAQAAADTSENETQFSGEWKEYSGKNDKAPTYDRDRQTLAQIIAEEAIKAGVDPLFALNKARVEGFDPNSAPTLKHARKRNPKRKNHKEGEDFGKGAKAGFHGIYQYKYGLRDEWAKHGMDWSRVYEPRHNAEVFMNILKKKRNSMKRVGLPDEDWLLYLTWQQGLEGTRQIWHARKQNREITGEGLKGWKGKSDAWRNKYASKIRANMRNNFKARWGMSGRADNPEDFLREWKKKYASFMRRTTREFSGAIEKAKASVASGKDLDLGSISESKFLNHIFNLIEEIQHNELV